MFKNKFGQVDEIQGQQINTGGVAILNLGGSVIYNLIIKERYLDTPTYSSLHRALKAMRKDATRRKSKKIAMPRIGIGEDGLEWERVKDLLVSVFKDTDIEITVCTNAIRDDEQIGSKPTDRTRKGKGRKPGTTTAEKKKAEPNEQKAASNYDTSRMLPEAPIPLKTELRRQRIDNAGLEQTDLQDREGGETLTQEDTKDGRETKITTTQQATGQDQTDRDKAAYHEKNVLHHMRIDSGGRR